MWAIKWQIPRQQQAAWQREASSEGTVGLPETAWGEESRISFPIQLGYSIHKRLFIYLFIFIIKKTLLKNSKENHKKQRCHYYCSRLNTLKSQCFQQINLSAERLPKASILCEVVSSSLTNTSDFSSQETLPLKKGWRWKASWEARVSAVVWKDSRVSLTGNPSWQQTQGRLVPEILVLVQQR